MKKAIMAILLALAIVLLTPVLARRLSEWRQAAQEILNQHKGSIEISSEYGKGTSVLITMPAAEAQA